MNSGGDSALGSHRGSKPSLVVFAVAAAAPALALHGHSLFNTGKGCIMHQANLFDLPACPSSSCLPVCRVGTVLFLGFPSLLEPPPAWGAGAARTGLGAVQACMEAVQKRMRQHDGSFLQASTWGDLFSCCPCDCLGLCGQVPQPCCLLIFPSSHLGLCIQLACFNAPLLPAPHCSSAATRRVSLPSAPLACRDAATRTDPLAASRLRWQSWRLSRWVG